MAYNKLHELPVEARLKLVEDLWDSIAADQESLGLTPEQRAELDRRIDAYEADRDPGRPAVVVLSAIRNAL